MKFPDVNIIGIDPGGTTGIAQLYTFENGLRFESCQVEAESTKGYLHHVIHNQITRIGQNKKRIPLMVGCERFVTGMGTIRKTRVNNTHDVIGYTTGLCDQLKVRMLLQNASDAKRVVSVETLRKLDWYRPGMDHANDAARHVGKVVHTHFPELWYALIHPM